MVAISANPQISGVVLTEQGTAPASPAAGKRKLYVDAAGGLKALTSGGAALLTGSRTALVVAASGASALAKSGADYVCDGTADEVEINAAIAAANGQDDVQLSGGTFNLNAAVAITVSGTVLKGSGFGVTRLYVTNGRNVSAVSISGTGTVGVQISDLLVDGNKAANTTGHGIAINTPYATTDTQHLLWNVDVVNAAEDGVNVQGDTRVVRAYSCRARYAGKNGWNLAGSDHVLQACVADACNFSGFVLYAGNAMLLGCKAFYCAVTGGGGYAGFRIEGSRAFLTHCEAQDNNESGMRLVPSAQGCGLTGCVCDSNGKGFAGAGPGLWIESNDNAVSGGYFFDRAANANKQTYGITLSGTASGNTIAGEQYRGNVSGTYNDTSSGTNLHPTAGKVGGVVQSAATTATPTGGSAAAAVLVGSAGVGVYIGTGAPGASFSAAKGSLYINTTATTTTTRLYINTNGGTTWTNFTTAA